MKPSRVRCQRCGESIGLVSKEINEFTVEFDAACDCTWLDDWDGVPEYWYKVKDNE